jgi:hypothetical protein
MNPDRQQIFGHVSPRLNPPLSPLNLRGMKEKPISFFSTNKKNQLLGWVSFFEVRFARKLLLSGFLVITSKGFIL